MLKKLAVLVMFAGVSLAAAATLKMKEFDVLGSGEQDGVATLHYVPGQDVTKIHVTITGFASNKAYGVLIGGGLLDAGVANGIVTNNGGNGEVNLSNPGNITGTGPLTVTIYADANGNGYYDSGEEVATGTAK
jgi:hypothetical protein